MKMENFQNADGETDWTYICKYENPVYMYNY